MLVIHNRDLVKGCTPGKLTGSVDDFACQIFERQVNNFLIEVFPKFPIFSP